MARVVIRFAPYSFNGGCWFWVAPGRVEARAARVGEFVSQSIDSIGRGVSKSVEWGGWAPGGNSFRSALVLLGAGCRIVSNGAGGPGEFVSQCVGSVGRRVSNCVEWGGWAPGGIRFAVRWFCWARRVELCRSVTREEGVVFGVGDGGAGRLDIVEIASGEKERTSVSSLLAGERHTGPVYWGRVSRVDLGCQEEKMRYL